jgi:hypothetical protein
VVIGQGNVALDCARILAKGGVGLYDTDLASHALSVLGGGVHCVTIVGRRGHVQGAFTIKELRELTKMNDEGYRTAFVVRSDELDMGAATDASVQELNSSVSGRPKKRIDALLREAAALRESMVHFFILSTPKHNILFVSLLNTIPIFLFDKMVQPRTRKPANEFTSAFF